MHWLFEFERVVSLILLGPVVPPQNLFAQPLTSPFPIQSLSDIKPNAPLFNGQLAHPSQASPHRHITLTNAGY
jgi:hypothetical protein